jgi:hypothetical protein
MAMADSRAAWAAGSTEAAAVIVRSHWALASRQRHPFLAGRERRRGPMRRPIGPQTLIAA